MARAAPTFRRFVKSITINDGGSNYSSAVGDTFLYIGPPSGAPETSPIQAAGSISVINGAIASITITEPGDGYANVPQVYIQSGIGTGTNSLTFLGSADSRRDAGTYVNVDVVSGKDGTGAKATVVVDGTGNVTSVNITTSGGVITINRVGYPIDTLPEVFYEINGEYIVLFDINQVNLINFTKFDNVKVNGVIYDTVEGLAQAMSDL